jgi:hypothetical protein
VIVEKVTRHPLLQEIHGPSDIVIDGSINLGPLVQVERFSAPTARRGSFEVHMIQCRVDVELSTGADELKGTHGRGAVSIDTEIRNRRPTSASGQGRAASLAHAYANAMRLTVDGRGDGDRARRLGIDVAQRERKLLQPERAVRKYSKKNK